MRRPMGVLCGAAGLLLTACVSGCAPQTVQDPVAVLLDRGRDPARRVAAARQIGPITDSTDPKRTVSAMRQVLWSDSQPTELRLLAMDRLIEYDPAGFWQTAEQRILDTDLWPVRGPLIDRAVQRSDPSFTAALVRSYARESQVYTDDQRPERTAIQALNPDESVQQAAWSVFVNSDISIDIATRADAWTLMNRLTPQKHLRDMLAETDSDHPLIVDLQAAQWLGDLPPTKQSLLWLMQLRSEPNRSYWDHARVIASGLTPDQRLGLSLRHLAVLQTPNGANLKWGKPAMMSRLNRRLASVGGVRRSEVGVMMRLPSESLADHAQDLCLADLWAIDRLLDALSDRGLVRELFAQADRDLADTTTEYGGVLAYESGRFVAIGFPPTLRVHDQKFYASHALINRMYTGLAHYHFHAQQYRNADYAGPGAGDLVFVDRLRATAVVFTFLDRDTLGVDYYQPEAVVVDLGVIHR